MIVYQFVKPNVVKRMPDRILDRAVEVLAGRIGGICHHLPHRIIDAPVDFLVDALGVQFRYLAFHFI